MNDIRDRNANLPIDSPCKNFALKSCCTLLDSLENLTTFRETYSNEFYIIFFVHYSRFYCCKDCGLHFYINDIPDRNVNLPIKSKCKNFASNGKTLFADANVSQVSKVAITLQEVSQVSTFAVAYNANHPVLICNLHISSFKELLQKRNFPQGGAVGSLAPHNLNVMQ